MTEEWRDLAGKIATLKRQVAELELENTQLRAMLALHDAQQNSRRRSTSVPSPLPSRGVDVTNRVVIIDHTPKGTTK